MSFLKRLRSIAHRIDALTPEPKPLRAYLNWGRANWEMLRRSGRIAARPLKLTFDATNVCQLRCPLCPTGLQLQDKPTQHADIATFQRLMDEVGDYVFQLDFFNWGEPLLNKHITDFVALASERRISSTISSNFSFQYDDERLRSLIRSGLNQLIVSLDGASVETAGTYRRRGDFDLVIENMRRLVRLKREMGSSTPYVVWRFLVFRFNEHELARATELAREIGVDRICFAPAFLDEGDFEISEEERARMKQWVPTDPRLSYYDPAEAASARPGELRKKGEPGVARSRCDWHYMSSAVNADGSVAACCALFSKKDDFGMLGEGPDGAYMAVVNNDKFVSIRERFAGRSSEPTGLVCEECPAPNLMPYARFVNLWIACITVFGVTRAVLRPFARAAVAIGLRARRARLVDTDVQSPVPVEDVVVSRP